MPRSPSRTVIAASPNCAAPPAAGPVDELRAPYGACHSPPSMLDSPLRPSNITIAKPANYVKQVLTRFSEVWWSLIVLRFLVDLQLGSDVCWWF